MNSYVKSILLAVLMLSASAVAIALRPTHLLADEAAPLKLDEVTPKAFGSWREEPTSRLSIVDPQEKELIDKIYTTTLTRNYINQDGYRVMLSISYGKDQSDASQVHRPEVCYPAQGFTLKSKQAAMLETSDGPIPVTRIETHLGPRNEPVTYWILVGDRVVGPGLAKKLVQLGYGLRGQIPDGLLFRVSSIDGATTAAYHAQDDFVHQLLSVLDPQARAKFIGHPHRDPL